MVNITKLLSQAFLVTILLLAEPQLNWSQDGSTRSLSRISAEVDKILANPELIRGNVGIKVETIDGKKSVVDINSQRYFMPASNMKSFTVAAALDNLSPNFRFVTSAYSAAKPTSDGTIAGDLIIYGRGDPSFSTNFYSGNYYGGIDSLADRIKQSGVTIIRGNLVGDETYFSSNAIPYGWEWDDLQWYYGAEISALSVNNNAVDLAVSPGRAGTNCTVNLLPNNSEFKIINTCQTSKKGSIRHLRVTKELGKNVLSVAGNVPVGDSGFKGYIAVSQPAKFFIDLLKERLQLKGVRISGVTKIQNRMTRNGEKLDTASLVEIAKIDSPPLSVISVLTLKPSQNLYTELILRALGEARGGFGESQKSSDIKGFEAVRRTLAKAGVAPGSVIQYDGSGLSRHNLVTPNSLVRLYKYMSKHRYSALWRNALPIAGIDGTLARRFKNTAAAGNVRAKTGTIDQVSTLAGYVTAKSGERFVFAILTNNIPDAVLRRKTIDKIVILLANYDSQESIVSN